MQQKHTQDRLPKLKFLIIKTDYISLIKQALRCN